MSFIVGTERLADGSELVVERTGLAGVVGIWRLMNYRGMTIMGTIIMSKTGSIYANMPATPINKQYVRCITLGDETDKLLIDRVEKIWAAAPESPAPQHPAISGNGPIDDNFVNAF